MDKSLKILSQTIKKIIVNLKPYSQPLSFLILTGKNGQGRRTLLKQSHLEHITIDTVPSTDVYYNGHGLIVELGEAWLNKSTFVLQQVIKTLNNAHPALAITGIICGINIQPFIRIAEPETLASEIQLHARFMQPFIQNLPKIPVGIIFTHMDTLSGFCEFFQTEHSSELRKALGFSLTNNAYPYNTFKAQFEQFIEALGQQVLTKIHPARSSLKRTLIREFPMQIASMRLTLQSIIESIIKLKAPVLALYFTSSEQGGEGQDKLTPRIQREYALTIPNQTPLATNHRAYFVEGALRSFQKQTKQQAVKPLLSTHWIQGSIAATCTFIAIFGYHYLHTASYLDKASQHLLEYEATHEQPAKLEEAINHLNQAKYFLDKISAQPLKLNTISTARKNLALTSENTLYGKFLPNLLAEVEMQLKQSKGTPSELYQALKVYLMLGQPQYQDPDLIIAWFKNAWQPIMSSTELDAKIRLLKLAFNTHRQPLELNNQLVNDTRQFLNALPKAYLYYSLIKPYFSKETIQIELKGYNLPVKNIPVYFTKSGYKATNELIDSSALSLHKESWVLDSQQPASLTKLLEEAYAYDYVLFWKNIIQKANLPAFQNFKQANQITALIQQSHTFAEWTKQIQQETSPLTNDPSNRFNELIASQFTELSLISPSAIGKLNYTINELNKLLGTLAILDDQGKTAFTIAKSRFDGDALTNPISNLYKQVDTFPEPIHNLSKQLADQIWGLLLQDTRRYINTLWEKDVYAAYKNNLLNKYPFDNTSKNEVDLNTFENFFSPNGIITTFVAEYIKPFLDTSTPDWKPKTLDNFALPMSPEFLNQLIRANIITNMFFANNNAHANVKLSLQKLMFDPDISSLTLTIGSQTVADNPSNESFTSFEWPASPVKLIIKNTNDGTLNIQEEGPWGLFRLLSKITVVAEDTDPPTIQLIFNHEGHSAQYTLKAQNDLNPLTPGILSEFTLNKTLR